MILHLNMLSEQSLEANMEYYRGLQRKYFHLYEDAVESESKILNELDSRKYFRKDTKNILTTSS